MTRTDELMARAEALLQSQSGYRYRTDALRAKLEAGLVAGDAMHRGSQRVVWLGNGKVRRDNLVDGAWVEGSEIDCNEQAAESMLVSVAAQMAQGGA